MEISAFHRQQIESGHAILFLGAGATYGAKGPNGETPLNGDQLRDKIAESLLDGEFTDRPLAEVAQYARELSSLLALQRLVSSYFEPLQPAPHHHLIALFRWKAIVTTNYDYVIERAYEQCSEPLQRPEVITRNEDQLGHALENQNVVPLLKLHGSLSTINDPSLPLILASDEYAFGLESRDRLFRAVGDWASEYPIVFVGYRLADPHIRDRIFDPTDIRLARPQHAIVSPTIKKAEFAYWSRKHFDPIAATFESFLKHIDSVIPPENRQLAALRAKTTFSLSSLIVHGTPSDDLVLYLDNRATHVRQEMPVEACTPQEFFRGSSATWYPIQKKWDVERSETDSIVIEAILEEDENPRPRLFLLHGHAGSGKTVALRRIAWDAATVHGKLVIWVENHTEIDPLRFEEMQNLTNERIFVFVDEATTQIDGLQSLYERFRNKEKPITIIAGARWNEWFSEGGALEPIVERSVELYRLRSREIDELLRILEETECLGELKADPPENRHEYFVLTAERQLLVALHEATLDETFDQIVYSEYKNIAPAEAKVLYLDVCTLNRFGVGVRAGLLSRVSGITLREFRERLFKPLHHVVETYFDGRSQDYAYRARHPVVADMVFRKALTEPHERCDQVVRIIGSMNVSFETDRIAFEQLIRGREIANLFDDKELGERIFRAAGKAAADQSHVQHQTAVFELKHAGGNLEKAAASVKKALETAGAGTASIRHTEALILRERGNKAASKIEREKFREEAKEILKRQMKKPRSPHAFHAYGLVVLDEIKENLSENGGQQDKLEGRIVADGIGEAERAVGDGLSRFPDDPYLKGLEAQLAEVIRDAPRAQSALEQAWAANPGHGYVAVRLARIYKESGDLEGANRTLRKTIEYNPNAREAHLELARVLTAQGPEENREFIRRHLRASFTDGDSNYAAQHAYARFEFLYGDREEARRIFGNLGRAKVDPRIRDQVRLLVCDEQGQPRKYHGAIVTLTDAYAFVRITELGEDVFIHRTSVGQEEWDRLTRGTQIELAVGFSYRGPAGTMVRI